MSAGPTWPDVGLAALNVAQVLGLAYLAWQQTLSARERRYRRDKERWGRASRPDRQRSSSDHRPSADDDAG